jgi:alkaline phosphatase
MRIIAAAAGLWLAGLGLCQAQTIYPLNRAEILAGSRFDLKVEFPGGPAQGEVTVTINGRPADAVLGKPATFAQKEDGLDHSAYWIRDTQITEPGVYVVEATRGAAKAAVSWEVYGTGPRKAKNVILFIGDGMTIANRTAARIMSKGIVEGRYGGELAMDDMPAMAMISTAGTDSIVTDSANSAHAYTTGHKSCVNALGVYCARNKGTLDHPKVETITELVKRNGGLAVGVVTNAEIEDATPAAMIAHTRRRSDYNDIVKMYHATKPDVIMGGGSPNFLPKSTAGSKRTDDEDFIKKFEADGYKFVTTKTEMLASAGATKLLGLFNTSNVDGALDLRLLKKGTVDRFPDQPDVAEMTRTAIDILSKDPRGFVLMVESGRIDKYSHSLDWERSVFDTIMLDNAVKIAKDFAGARNDTLIIVVPDHAHGMSIIGTYDDARPGQLLRDKLGTYAEAGFPNYPPPDKDGYPTSIDVSRRMAIPYSAYPDYCTSGKPFLDGEFVPAVKGPDGKTNIANEKYCGAGATRVTGNLPFDAPSGVHSGDDVVLTAMGPNAEKFRGHLENIKVFRVIVDALGLAPEARRN